MRTNSSTRRVSASLVAGLAALSLVVAACGSSSKSGAGTTTTGAAASTTAGAPSTDAPTTTAADPLGTPNAAKGDPIIIGTINEGGGGAIDQQSAKTLAGITVASKYINDYLGGINGHPIQIESCGNKSTPAGATDCANQMVEKKIDVYTDAYSGFETQIVNVLTAAKIPLFLFSSSSQEGLTTPGVWVATAGYPGTLGAFAVHAKGQGVKKFAMVTIDVPAATGAAKALGGIAFGKEGVGFDVVAVPPGTADMTPQLQAAVSGGADALGVTGDASFCTSFLQAYKTLALTAKKYVIGTCLDPSVVSAVGDTLDGSFAPQGKIGGTDEPIFKAAVAKYGESGTDNTIAGGVGDGWIAMMTLFNALKGYTGAGHGDTAGLAAAIKAAKDVTIPMSGGLTFTCDGTALKLLANICSSQFQIGTADKTGAVNKAEKVDASAAFG